MIQWLFRNAIGLMLDLFERYLRNRDVRGVTVVALGAIERKAWRMKNDLLRRHCTRGSSRPPWSTNPPPPPPPFALSHVSVPSAPTSSQRPIRVLMPGDENLPDGSFCANGCCELKNGAWIRRPDVRPVIISELDRVNISLIDETSEIGSTTWRTHRQCSICNTKIPRQQSPLAHFIDGKFVCDTCWPGVWSEQARSDHK